MRGQRISSHCIISALKLLGVGVSQRENLGTF